MARLKFIISYSRRNVLYKDVNLINLVFLTVTFLLVGTIQTTPLSYENRVLIGAILILVSA